MEQLFDAGLIRLGAGAASALMVDFDGEGAFILRLRRGHNS